MSEEIINLKKVSFNECLNKDGQIIKALGFSLEGEVLLYHNLSFENENIQVASVRCTDGELNFVPFDSLVFYYDSILYWT